MPTNKNALIRYMILDKKLSDRHHYYTCRDLLEEVNKGLEDAGFPKIGGYGDYESQIKSGKRVIQKDIEDLKSSPFNLEIDSSEKVNGSPIYRYADPTRSLFSTKLKDDEKKLLKEVLNTLGQFSGLDNFEWLEDLQDKLNEESSIKSEPSFTNKTIVFSTNPAIDSNNLLGTLFTYITNKQTLDILYKPFDKEERHYPVAPYQLRQFNNRWYLICTFIDYGKEGDIDYHYYEKGFYLNLPLDRIQSITPLDSRKYKFIDCNEDLDEFYEDCIGLTKYENREPQEILLAVRNSYIPFIETRPLHLSQKQIKAPGESVSLHNQYPGFEDYTFYKLYLIPNKEMRKAIMREGSDIILLSPEDQRKIILEQARMIVEKTNG